jgi:antitoxin ParD1/3/4
MKYHFMILIEYRELGGEIVPSSYTIGEHFEQFIQQQISTGRYQTASEVLRDALRLLEEEEHARQVALEALRSEVRKGRASGKGKPGGEVLTRLQDKYRRMAAERGTK